MNDMSELSAGETHDLIHVGGEVVAVVVPIEEYRQLREALAEHQVDQEFEVAHARHLARQEAGEIRFVSHQEAGRRLGLTAR